MARRDTEQDSVHKKWISEQRAKNISNADILGKIVDMATDPQSIRQGLRQKVTAAPDVLLIGVPPKGLIEVTINDKGVVTGADILERKPLALSSVAKWLGDTRVLIDSTRVLRVDNLKGTNPSVTLRVRRTKSDGTEVSDMVEEEGPSDSRDAKV